MKTSVVNPQVMTTNKSRNLADILLWWMILAIFTAATLLLPASHARAQQTGPLPAATPSDQPPTLPRASVPAQIGGKPNLSGTWVMNKDESDDPREAMQEAGANRGGGGGRVHVGMGGGGMGGGGGWGGRSGGNGGGAGRRGSRNGGENPVNDLSSLTIDQTATSATVTSESGRVLAQYVGDSAAHGVMSSADNSSSSSSAPTGSSTSPSTSSSTPGAGSGSPSSSSDPHSQNGTTSTPLAAQWKGTQLVAVSPGRRQGTTTRTYELSPDGKQLYVTTKIDNPRFKKPVTFRLVYDPMPSAG